MLKEIIKWQRKAIELQDKLLEKKDNVKWISWPKDNEQPIEPDYNKYKITC